VEVRGYRLISEVARGGQGVVYRAVREGEGEARFAVKVLRPASSPEDAMSHHARLEREARVLRTVEHERIVRPHEVGATPDGRAYLVMDFVEGTALTPETVKGLEVAHRVALVGAVARTVGAAHARGVVHRDLKPSNILVARDGIPVVLDFGMASVVDAEEMRQTLTTTGQFVGTYLWASPEQLRGERELSAASDVYSLGVLMHQLVTGRGEEIGDDVHRAIGHAVEAEDIRPDTALLHIAASATVERIFAVSTHQHVIAGTAFDAVGTAITRQAVVESRAQEILDRDEAVTSGKAACPDTGGQ
jgi:serine/threonine protein kinase